MSSMSHVVTPMPTVPSSNPLFLPSPPPPVSTQRPLPQCPPTHSASNHQLPHAFTVPHPLYSLVWWVLRGFPGNRAQSWPPFWGGRHCRCRVMVPPQVSEHGDQGDQELHSPSTARVGQDSMCVRLQAWRQGWGLRASIVTSVSRTYCPTPPSDVPSLTWAGFHEAGL